MDKANLTLATTVHTDSPDAALVGNASLGDSLHDSAQVSGIVTGFPPANSVTFTFFSDPAVGDCTSTATPAGSHVITAAGLAHPSSSTGALGAGAYAFRANLVGDANYTVAGAASADSACEPFTVDKAQLEISTEVHKDGTHTALAGNLFVGDGAHDSATVTGKVDALALPDVTFYFFDDGVTCTNGSTTGGTALNTLAPDGTTGVAHPSDSKTNLAAGDYNFMAVVASNGNYTGRTSGCEPFTVVAGRVTLNKTFQDGPFTHPGQACFTLSRVPAATPPPITSSTNPQCDAGTSLSFTWLNLTAGDYTITETTTPAGYVTMTPITFTVDLDHLNFTFGRNDPLQPGDLRIEKRLGPGGTLWTGADVTFYICRNDPIDQSTPEAVCDASGPNWVATVHIPSDGNPVTITGLSEGYYTVCEVVPPTYTVSPAACQVGQVVAGVTGGSASLVTFTNTPSGEGCTPGFWQGRHNGRLLWNQTTDPIAIAAGFTTTTTFNSFFGLTSAESGFSDTFTMLDAITASGGGGAKLARHGVAGLLNIAAGLSYPFVGATPPLYDQIQTAYQTGVFEPLATQLAAANELGCPLGGGG